MPKPNAPAATHERDEGLSAAVDPHRKLPLDLLSPTPLARLDSARVETALDFAFAAGGADTALSDCLTSARQGPTSWDRSAFAGGIFLDDLLALAFPIVVDGVRWSPCAPHLAAIVASPPDDRGVVEFRQAILRELLDDPALRRRVEELYVALRRFEGLFEPAPVRDGEIERRRRMDILAAVRELVVSLAEGFGEARSGIARLSEFGAALRDGEPFRRLEALLEVEGKAMGLDVHLCVDRDGKLRNLALVRVHEPRGNPFYESRVRRLWRRLSGLLRGQRFSDDEVFEAVVDGVFGALRSELGQLFQLRGDLELYLAALGFRNEAMARGLSVCLPDFLPVEDESPARLEGLFNPLLFREKRPPVAADFAPNRRHGVTVLTGPNSGGKTRLLEAVAIAQLLGQSGVFVPAAEARLLRADGLFVSLVERTRADETEGRLGGELLRIRRVFEELGPGSMVVLDELCSGTNPSEGEELFDLVTSLLARLEPQAVVSTHLLDFAARLRDRGDPAFSFLQAELDAEDEPTFRFVPGVAATSLARKTAARHGVTREELTRLVEKSRRSLAPARRRPADVTATPA